MDVQRNSVHTLGSLKRTHDYFLSSQGYLPPIDPDLKKFKLNIKTKDQYTTVMHAVNLNNDSKKRRANSSSPESDSSSSNKNMALVMSNTTPKTDNIVSNVGSPNFLNAPQVTPFKSLSTTIFDNLLSTLNQSVKPRNAITILKNTQIPTLENLSSSSSSKAQLPSPQLLSSKSHRFFKTDTPEFSIKESKSKVAIRFLSKNSKRICGTIKFYISEPVAANSSKFRSLIFSVKNTVETTLESNISYSKNLNHITSILDSTLTGQHLPDCLEFLGLSLTTIDKQKRMKKQKKFQTISKHSKSKLESTNRTFLNLSREPETLLEGDFNFLKPKVYECESCYKKFFKLSIYFKHIRRHEKIVRCAKCNKAFSSIIDKRRHQLHCKNKSEGSHPMNWKLKIYKNHLFG